MRVTPVLAVVIVLCWHAAAAAHGRPPALQQLRFDPNDPDRIVAQATWGAALSHDGGRTWSWACAAAMAVDARDEDPRFAILAGGRTLAATFDGLWSDEGGFCEFGLRTPELADRFVIDVRREPGRPDRAWVVRTDGEAPDQLFVSSDAGETFEPVGDGFADVLIDRIRLAPSRPERMYAAGQRPRREGVEPAVFVFRSDDAGASFERFEIPVEEGEWNVLLHAVHPDDEDLLLSQVVHFNGEDTPERLVRSEDGGATWTTPVRIPQIDSIVVADDSTVFVGSRLGGLWASTDGGLTFELRQPDVHVRCLAARGDELYVCADQTTDGYALARSTDAAATLEPILTLPQIETAHSCERCSDVGIQCPLWLPDIIVDLELDQPLPDGSVFSDGGTGRPRDAGTPAECLPDAGAPPLHPGGGCDCSAAATPARLPWLLVAGALVTGLLVTGRVGRRRRSPSKSGSSSARADR